MTGLGHAGMFVETRGGSVLCDPWVNPAFFGSWFPFPDNRGLNWERFGRCDYLYISHRHKDHFDPQLLTEYVSRDTTVLLPEYPTAELETDLRELGFDNILYTRAGEEFTRNGLRMMITPLRGPGDGPIGDSALSLDDGTAVLLNQNDSHPLDVEKIRAFGEPDAYFTQFSGAIWWPMVYDLPEPAKQRFAELKRKSQSDRALFYIDQVGSPNVFPMAGPPCFLDEDLFRYNGYGTDDTSIFTDQRQFLDELAVKRPETAGHLFLPGTVIELENGSCTVTQSLFSDVEIDAMFTDKWSYLRDFQAARGHEVVAEKASRAPVPADMFEQLQAWWEPLMKRAPFLCEAIGAQVRFEIGELDLVVDFPAREVRRYADEKVRYWYRTSADLVATNLVRGEIDWSNSLFLSLRFTAGRVGKFNEYLYTFFKCLSEERIDYVENWYSEQGDTGEDIVVGDWIVQRRCPHLRADLKKFATSDGKVLTCNLHSWQFDLASGRCLTSRGHEIRARKVGSDA